MTEEELKEIEQMLEGEEEPDVMDWIDMVEGLVAEVRRLKKEQKND